MGWKHNELMRDLSRHLLNERRMVWTDMQLGPSGSPRPDVYTIEKSYSRPAPMAYEVKVSTSDLRSDLTKGKWQSYLKFAQAVVFAVPEGLCTKNDIPEGCGLIVRKSAVWRYAKRATLKHTAIPQNTCMKLLIDGVNRPVSPKTRTERFNAHQASKRIRKLHGKAVAEAVSDLHSLNTRIEALKGRYDYECQRIEAAAEEYRQRLKSEAEREHCQWKTTRQEVLDWLGLEAAGSHEARRKIQALREACDADERLVRVTAGIQLMKRSLANAARQADVLLDGGEA